MNRSSREGEARGELRVRGLGLRARFALYMSLALLPVLCVAGWALYGSSSQLSEHYHQQGLARTVLLNASEPLWEQDGDGHEHPDAPLVHIYPVRFGSALDQRGELYQAEVGKADRRPYRLLVPEPTSEAGEVALRVIIAILLVLGLVAAGVALWVASQVSSPIQQLVDDIRRISRGDLAHRSRVHGSGEVELLARTIDRMGEELERAQEAKVELSIRQREIELAAGVREALLPSTTPLIPGWDMGSAHISSARFGGDFHDYLELPDGRIGLLVCDVSGHGVPAALVGANARSFLRSELSRGGDLAASFQRINRELARDMRRGMFVTALYVLVDPRIARAKIACAGHKVPLLRWSSSEKKLRSFQPEGIALGFDKGPVFDRTLVIEEIEMLPGDRLLLANSGPMRTLGASGEELGDKAFYQLFARHAESPTTRCLKALRQALEDFSGERGLNCDVSLLTIAREESA